MWQLEPPRGTFLGAIPAEMLRRRGQKTKLPHAAYGQRLAWGGPTEGVQGVTELVRCERTQDAWLKEVQDQFRHGRLTAVAHAFLHGKATAVPGSWHNGHANCGSRTCEALATNQVAPERILEEECKVCKSERRSKALVAATPQDPRLRNELKDATCIFATNAVKYHVNRTRAREFAAKARQQIYYSIAEDLASAAVLAEKPHLEEDKVKWLQRHDRESGNLYGTLPLCIGMPVSATDHLDRERRVLRGCAGTVRGWTHTGDKSEVTRADGHVRYWAEMPAAVYVKFRTSKTWRVDGIQEDCVLPVAPVRSAWFLDGKRKKPQLRVSRRQLPLSPAFALTAHGAQGITAVNGAVVDIAMKKGDNPLTSYVAMTRVEGRQKLGIFRPFDLEPFQRGDDFGRNLLLRVWRGEVIDWEAIRKKYLLEKECVECLQRKGRCAYTAGRWKREDASGVCKECTGRHESAGHPWQCCVCYYWQPRAGFLEKWHRTRSELQRVCCNCIETHACARCAESKTESDFSKAAWQTRRKARQVCKDCSAKERGHWTCLQCNERGAAAAFSRYKRARNGKQECNACLRARDTKAIAKKSAARLARRRAAQKRRALAEIRACIADIIRARERRSAAAQASEPRDRGKEAEKKAERSQRTYTCPHCSADVESGVWSGTVHSRRHCGRNFQVREGQVVRREAGARYEHACPTCGATVQSSTRQGRIRVQHEEPNSSRFCQTKDWRTK